MDSAHNVLEADSIIVKFGERSLLSNVYVRCDQGNIVGLLGRNGCGKSTLLNVIFGSHEPEQKSVRINGEPITKGYRNARIALLPQNGLIPSNIKIQEAFKLFDIDIYTVTSIHPELDKFLHKKPDSFSGGELRMIELILILYSKSEFCLLDEPFSGLSPLMIEKVIEVMQHVKDKKGIIITDHLYRQVIKCADRMYCISSRGVTNVQNEEQLVALGYLP